MSKKSDRPITPNDPVRFTAIMRREDRAKFKLWCETRGLDMEQVGAEWIMERLADETAHADDAKRKGRK